MNRRKHTPLYKKGLKQNENSAYSFSNQTIWLPDKSGIWIPTLLLHVRWEQKIKILKQFGKKNVRHLAHFGRRPPVLSSIEDGDNSPGATRPFIFNQIIHQNITQQKALVTSRAEWLMTFLIAVKCQKLSKIRLNLSTTPPPHDIVSPRSDFWRQKTKALNFSEPEFARLFAVENSSRTREWYFRSD